MEEECTVLEKGVDTFLVVVESVFPERVDSSPQGCENKEQSKECDMFSVCSKW